MKEIATLKDSLELMKNVINDLNDERKSKEEKEQVLKEAKIKSLVSQTIVNNCNVIARISSQTGNIASAKKVLGDLSE